MKILIAFFLVLSFSGCERYRCDTGKVVDKLTNAPLDSVFCEVLTGNQTLYTGGDGSFDLCNPFGGCVPKCKDIMLRFSKPGYKTVSVENPESASVVYLER